MAYKGRMKFGSKTRNERYRQLLNASGSDDYWANVVMLQDYAGVDAATEATDLSTSAHVSTFFGNAQIDTAQSEFSGGSSLLLDGTGDYVTLPDSDDWTFGTSDFTIDISVRFNVLPSGSAWFLSHYNATTGERAWVVGYGAAEGIRFAYSEDSDNNIITDRAFSASTNTWYKIRISKIGTNLYIFVDGVLLGAAEAVGAINIHNSTHVLTVGGLGDITPGSLINGWIDNIRITNGVGRSFETYNVETEDFPSN